MKLNEPMQFSSLRIKLFIKMGKWFLFFPIFAGKITKAKVVAIVVTIGNPSVAKAFNYIADGIWGLAIVAQIVWIGFFAVSIISIISSGEETPITIVPREQADEQKQLEIMPPSSLPQLPPAPTSTPQTPPPQQQSTTELKVTFVATRVIDGDTIELENGQKVRYIGIDTPETVDPRKPVQCFGVEAKNRNKELVEGKQVRLEKDISETDKYGRLVRYVYVGDTFINLALVQEGFASSYTYPPDVKYQNQFIEAERIAREQKKGLWGSCPISSATQETTQIQTSDQQSSGCTIKGNISSSGEKIYHLEGCGSYSKTKIDEARGEHWFCTEEEAISAGWRKALNCL